MRVHRLLVRAMAVLGASATVGLMALSPAAAIANGVAAQPGEFPYAVQLTMDDITRSDGTTYDSACSGVLISPTWIMTAGHCFHDGDRNRVGGGPPRYATTARLGTVSTADPTAGETRLVNWVEQSGTNDIAVARLDGPVEATPLALGTRAPARGQVLTFAGWGATTSSGPPSQDLYWGQVKVTSVKPTTVLVKGYAPAADTSACPYDSGAPYIATPQGAPPTLVSVESSGPTCPHRQQETTARVDVVAGWVRSVVDDLPQ